MRTATNRYSSPDARLERAGTSCSDPAWQAQVTSQGFVAVEKNGRWGRAIEVPGLGTLNAGRFADVISVSCGSAGNCAAGGNYQMPNGAQGFVVSEKNGRWGRAIEVPGLVGLNVRGAAEVTSVSCGSAGNCAAGGDYQMPNGAQGFEKNGVWGQAIEVPGLGALDKGGEALLNSVSCAPVGTCAAGASVPTVRYWRSRYAAGGIRALEDPEFRSKRAYEGILIGIRTGGGVGMVREP